MKPDTKVLLVDDHNLVRAGISHLVEKMNGFSVIAEASNIDEAVSKMAEQRPDIVVTDLDMGHDNGMDILKKIKAEESSIKTVVLSMHSSKRMVMQALEYGASAYILKEAAPEELEFALQSISRGEVFLSPAITTKMLVQIERPENKPSTPLDSLNKRQIEVLTLLAEGKSTKEIAYQLELSIKTISSYRIQIMERLEIRDLAGLVLFAAKHGLINFDL